MATTSSGRFQSSEKDVFLQSLHDDNTVVINNKRESFRLSNIHGNSICMTCEADETTGQQIIPKPPKRVPSLRRQLRPTDETTSNALCREPRRLHGRVGSNEITWRRNPRTAVPQKAPDRILRQASPSLSKNNSSPFSQQQCSMEQRRTRISSEIAKSQKTTINNGRPPRPPPAAASSSLQLVENNFIEWKRHRPLVRGLEIHPIYKKDPSSSIVDMTRRRTRHQGSTSSSSMQDDKQEDGTRSRRVRVVPAIRQHANHDQKNGDGTNDSARKPHKKALLSSSSFDIDWTRSPGRALRAKQKSRKPS